MGESELVERKVKIDEWTVNYVIVGRGKHVVLLMPGTMGTIMVNYEHQVFGLDRELLTIIAWDPPGHGKSYPPKRWFHDKFYEEYADLTYQFMKALPFSKYSLLGWCGGARASMILAAKHPDMVTALILWNTSTYFKPKEMEFMAKYRDPLKWSEKYKNPMVNVYGEQYLHDYWEGLVSGIERLVKEKGGEVCTSCLELIKCPTLILHGVKDFIVGVSHAHLLHDRIRGSTLHLFPEGKHDIHIEFAEEFNAVVRDYLLKIDMGNKMCLQ